MVSRRVRERRKVAAHARLLRKRENIVNRRSHTLWVIQRIAEGALPVIGKAIAGGVVALVLRWWLTE